MNDDDCITDIMLVDAMILLLTIFTMNTSAWLHMHMDEVRCLFTGLKLSMANGEPYVWKHY